MTGLSPHSTEFDNYAGDYDSALAQGLAVTGEDKNYFAQGRIAWLERCLRRLHHQPQSIMDFGCGTGAAAPFFLDLIAASSVLGIDNSAKVLDVAKRNYGSERTQFLLSSEYEPNEQIDLAFCNGVFHHVPLHDRPATVDYVYGSLRPGGLFAIWENNPWNPGARYVMSRIPFDRDAIMLTPAETRHLLQARHFEIVRTDFLFIFPRLLSWLRPVEPLVSRLPLGAQYQVLARKPNSASAKTPR